MKQIILARAALPTIAKLDAAILSNPQSAELYSERAHFRKKLLADKQGAIEDYTQAIALNPDNPLFYLLRSQTYQDLGDEQKAIQDYNEAMRLAPEGTMYCWQPSRKLS